MREQLEKMLAQAEDEHTKNQAVYHKALKDKANAEVKARAACKVASKSASNAATLKKTVDALPPPEPEEAAA